ncbi:MAG: hypothetical protein Q9170_005056 [Blastenia crenularia]
MDAISNTKVFRSEIFKVLVGPAEEPFYVHADVLARSEPLRRMTTGSWKEHEERTIRWPDCNTQTAEKFIEWLYHDDYSCPYPAQAVIAKTKDDDTVKDSQTAKHSLLEVDVEESKMVAVTEPEADGCEEPPIKKQKTRAAATTLMSLKELVGGDSTFTAKISQAAEFDLWIGHLAYTTDQLDYSETFTTHAELYVIACLYLLDDLKTMALKRLGAVLMSIGRPSAGSPVIHNILTIAQSIYSKTYQEDGEEEPLRNLITTFIALNYASFKNFDIDSLTTSQDESDRDFLSDLMRKLMLRVETLETEANKLPQATTANRPLPKTHELKCPSCNWQQTHKCDSACNGYFGAPASSFNARFLNGQGYQK